MTDSFERAWRERFQEFAQAGSDDASIAGWSQSGLAARFRRFRRLWGERKAGGCWLDAGCGAATYARYLASRGAHVVGADYSFESVVKGRERGDEGIDFVVADVRRLPLRQHSIAGALCFGVTQALSNSGDVINELRRCVAPGGEIWLDGLNRYCLPNAIRSWRRRIQRKPVHLRYEGPGALKRALKKAGFVNVRLHWMPIMPKALGVLQRWFESAPAEFALKRLTPLSYLVSHAFILTARSRITSHAANRGT
jgi:SAM-dependent methyltransferase